MTRSDTARGFLYLCGAAFLYGLGHALNYPAIEIVGPSVAASFMLVTPPITGALAYLLLVERLALPRVAGGALLLLGCYCNTLAAGLRRSPRLPIPLSSRAPAALRLARPSGAPGRRVDGSGGRGR